MNLSNAIEPMAAPARNVPPPVAARPPIRGLIGAAFVSVIVLLGGFGGWATLAPLTSATLASGAVKADTNRKTIQHLEGGIIREILVRNGDVVSKGQVLLRLDALDAEADRDAVRAQLDALAAREARLIAERDGLTSIAFPDDLLARRSNPIVAEMLNGQARIFADHKRALEDQEGVWVQRVEQYRAQIASLEAQINATERQLPLFEDELKDQKYLSSQGLALKPKLLSLERQILAGKGEIEANKGKIQSLREQISEANVQIKGVRSTQAKAVSEELREMQTKRGDFVEQLRKMQAKASRSEVVAPQDGAIMNMKFFAVGGVVPPGGAILDLVPLQEKLVLEVKIPPLDIDVVHPDLPATVRLVAYKQRTTPTLEGRVTKVSADAVVDEKANTTYYLAIVEVESKELARVPHVKLFPGMPVDVSIVTGERTLLAYIMQPLTDSFAHAFREE